MTNQENGQATRDISWWQPVIFAAMAGGMAWGIRGQYGHETGAMMAGLLVSLTLIALLCPQARLLNAARAIALATVAMGVGGSMTYGQTVGLTHDPELVGNWDALRWGLIGLAIKGSIWIGFCGLFFGVGLGGKRYGWREMFLLLAVMLGAYMLGIHLLNSPFDPSNKLLPQYFFSDSWYWQPETYGKPRFECWGGLLFALLTGMLYASIIRRDGMAFKLAFWGMLGGALGFPAGQGIQAYHAWNVEYFKQLDVWLQDHNYIAVFQYFNWWNMMETTYGCIMGATLGFGVWLSRKKIQLSEPAYAGMPSWFEGSLLVIHLALLVGVVFFSIPAIDYVYDLGLCMVVIPIACIVGGRIWPYLIIFPITLIPIAGKTLRNLAIDNHEITLPLGATVYVAVPLVLFSILAAYYANKPQDQKSGQSFARIGLLTTGWMYFLLNYAIFRFPWPWEEWTGRTPNGIIYAVFIFCLTIAALFLGLKEKREPKTEEA